MHHSDDIERLRQRGERLTPQRMLTLDIIKRGSGHLTAEEIHRQVQAHQPYVSIATIYRTLQWLQDHGLVHMLSLDGERNYYEYRDAAPHHHLICRQCNAIIQIDDAIVDNLRTAIHQEYAFTPVIEHLAINGLCAYCAEQHNSDQL